MIEKYIKKKITRTDLEKRMLEGSLQGEYNKYYANPIIDTLIKTKIKHEKTSQELISINSEMIGEED